MNEYPNQTYHTIPANTEAPAASIPSVATIPSTAAAAGITPIPGTPEDTASRPFHTKTPQPAGTVPEGLTAEEKKKHIRHFHMFSISSILYALFYTFCLYRNASGITYPFYVGGTLFYFFLSLKKLGISAKKDSIFYAISLTLLGISTFCTDDANIIFMNKMGIFVLFFVLMIHNFHEDARWSFSKYMAAIFRTIFGSIGTVGRPVSDFCLFLKERKTSKENRKSNGQYIFIGVLISLPLVLIVLLLLCSADIVFASLFEDILLNMQIPENFFGICMTLCFAFCASYCITAYLTKKSIKDKMTDKRTGEPVLAITITSILSAIYLLFCAIQVIYLFPGKMALPNGYSYATYAREGFFQLLFICMMNLCLVLICLGRFKAHKALKAILTVISLCTYIMIASSTMRMLMYIRYYSLTFLRIFVLWSLAVIFLLLSGVLLYIYKESFPLFRYSMLIVTVLYIGLSFSHPDYIIARYNINQLLNEENISPDTWYLTTLSADAAPAILNKETLADLTATPGATVIISNRTEDDNWAIRYAVKISNSIERTEAEGTKIRSFNLSRFTAKKYTSAIGF